MQNSQTKTENASKEGYGMKKQNEFKEVSEHIAAKLNKIELSSITKYFTSRHHKQT